MNLLEDAFNEKFYYIIIYELDHIKKNLENIKLNSNEKIEYVRNYIENGLLIPIIFYFKKIFTYIHHFSGEEMINLFSLIQKTINLKLFISEFKIDFWNCYTEKEKNINLEDNQQISLEENNENNNSQNYYTVHKNSSIIDGKYFINNKFIDLTYESLNYIKSNKFSIFDYTSLYQILDKELFSLIKERKELNIAQIFKLKYNKTLNKKRMKNDIKLLFEKNKKYFSKIHKKLLKALIIYKYSKPLCLNENNSSLLNILPEITLGYETNYRNLLINILINYGNEIDLNNEFAEISYFLLFKLLSLQTIEIQNDIKNILGGADNDDLGFLKEFGNILYYRIILLVIDFLNPPDKLYQSNYFISCNLIYLFKYLCKEHNNYFQRFFIKSLSYSYINNSISFFSFKKKDDSEISYSEGMNSSVESINTVNDLEFNINFYDFFLYILTKIILISNWENNYKNDFHHQNPFLYDLFSSILELLTEIIQGCEPDVLAFLCVNLEEGVKEAIENGKDLEKYKNIDSFEFFIKNIKNILLNEKYNSKFINEIKSNIIHFITSILEEKNCNEIMKKNIKKYININSVFKIISIIMKSYYLNEENSKSKTNNFEEIKNNLNDLKKVNDKQNEINKSKTAYKRVQSFYNPIFRPKMNNVKKKFRYKFSIDGDTSSNIRLVDNSHYLYKDFDKKYS